LSSFKKKINKLHVIENEGEPCENKKCDEKACWPRRTSLLTN